MNPIPTISPLVPGDQVEIIAPASSCSEMRLNKLVTLLESYQLKCHVDENIFGEDLLCANTDVYRFKALERCLFSSDIKAIICARGGYGSMHLLPYLADLPRPPQWKWFVGMSDITALHLHFNQKWHWPVIHGTMSCDVASLESIQAVKSILFGEVAQVIFQAQGNNKAAQQTHLIKAPIVGGNLCLVQASLGTPWQINTKNKIIFLEEVSERGYRIDRMLEQLKQAGIFKDAAAVVLGDFLNGDEKEGGSYVEPVLSRFAAESMIPVVRIQGAGHGYVNTPFCLGVTATIQCSDNLIKLTIPCR